MKRSCLGLMDLGDEVCRGFGEVVQSLKSQNCHPPCPFYRQDAGGMSTQSLLNLEILCRTTFRCCRTVQLIICVTILSLARKRSSVCHFARQLPNLHMLPSPTTNSAPAPNAREQDWHRRGTVTGTPTRDVKAHMSSRPECHHYSTCLEQKPSRRTLGSTSLFFWNKGGGWRSQRCGLCCLRKRVARLGDGGITTPTVIAEELGALRPIRCW